jgi:hypothetical protein
MQFQTTAARGMLCGSTGASTCKQFSLFGLLDRDFLPRIQHCAVTEWTATEAAVLLQWEGDSPSIQAQHHIPRAGVRPDSDRVERYCQVGERHVL